VANNAAPTRATNSKTTKTGLGGRRPPSLISRPSPAPSPPAAPPGPTRDGDAQQLVLIKKVLPPPKVDVPEAWGDELEAYYRQSSRKTSSHSSRSRAFLVTCKGEEYRPPDDPAEAHEGGPGPRLPERGEHAVTMRERGGGVAGTVVARAAAASAVFFFFTLSLSSIVLRTQSLLNTQPNN